MNGEVVADNLLGQKRLNSEWQVLSELTVPPPPHCSSGISSWGNSFLLSVSGSFPPAGGGSCPAGRGPEGAAGAYAGQAQRDPGLCGREPHRPGEGEQQPETSTGMLHFTLWPYYAKPLWIIAKDIIGGIKPGSFPKAFCTHVALQEDLSRLRRKLEKQKKVEVYSDADEILQEEINQYKVRKRKRSSWILHRETRPLFVVRDFYKCQQPQGSECCRLMLTDPEQCSKAVIRQSA